MAQAVELAKLFTPEEVDWALGQAAVHARFAEADLASILDHHASAPAAGPVSQASEDRFLTQGTSGWAALGASAFCAFIEPDLFEVTPVTATTEIRDTGVPNIGVPAAPAMPEDVQA